MHDFFVRSHEHGRLLDGSVGVAVLVAEAVERDLDFLLSKLVFLDKVSLMKRGCIAELRDWVGCAILLVVYHKTFKTNILGPRPSHGRFSMPAKVGQPPLTWRLWERDRYPWRL